MILRILFIVTGSSQQFPFLALRQTPDRMLRKRLWPSRVINSGMSSRTRRLAERSGHSSFSSLDFRKPLAKVAGKRLRVLIKGFDKSRETDHHL
jgi:hypothetical protein